MAQKWVSFEEVKSQVSIRDVLAHYALMQGTTEKPSKHGLELRLRCPFHEDKTPSLSINAETGKFHCFGCHAKGGDIFDFVVTKEGITAGDGRRAGARLPCCIKDWFGVEASSHTSASKHQRPLKIQLQSRTSHRQTEATEEAANPPLTFAFKHLDTRHPYLTQDRGLKEATIDVIRAGASRRQGHHA